MNELADQLKIDPVKLRVMNEPKIDESWAFRSHRGTCSIALNRCAKVWLVQAHSRVGR